ncbi:hypothetical protein N7492_005653 [Penicillium capsulatum]|uniref:CBM21 domain-containing protein n=1 Tax=Penicillium capsulatum TaxID=69766 RepID=A0A9W9ICN6_9EURO|nr:hypothetical protein N7492_005653 [Penicillium capsulatum]KAJ6135250.1 hypothetical protein N7512_000410 [Penicillium capsulatum]
MPYTAPLKSLLAAQHIEYCDPRPEASPERPSLARSASARVQNSRSYSSTSYTRRHRRSQSICKSPGSSESTESASRLSPTVDPHASLRQSPPPLNNAAIPPGAVISPPESAPNSSDEESPYRRDQGINLEELEAAVRSIEPRKDSSPEAKKMGPAEVLGTEAQPSSSLVIPIREVKPNHLRLSKEARKIAHSRSATETAIIDLKREEAIASSPDDSDVELSPKPPMVRKKSGELVRPALRPPAARRRPSSMPGTPVYAKAVHFDSQLEHIRHFLQLDRPLAVSANTSPVDSHDTEGEFPFGRQEAKSSSFEWELRLANFPHDSSSRAFDPVRLERLFLSPDKNTLIGSVAVANLDFQKNVAARFTFDHWRTVSEVSATYFHDVRQKHAHDGYDRFSFEIKLADQAHLERKTMFVCIRYNVKGQEFWDNNNGMNYQADFIKTQKNTASKPSGGPRPALPRSRTFTGSHTTRPLSMPPSFDDFPELNQSVAFSDPFHFPAKSPLPSADDIDTVGPPKRRENPHRQAFGNRYDFGASLTAAMRTKQPVDRTTLTARARSEQPSEATAVAPTEKDSKILPKGAAPVGDGGPSGAQAENPKPSSLIPGKPCLESSGYKELVDKYCFYGSSQPSPPKQSFTVNVPRNEGLSHFKGGAPSPPLSPRTPAPMPSSGAGSPRLRAASQSPAIQSPRTSPRTSPVPTGFRFPYHESLSNGFMNDPQSSAEIRGGFDLSSLLEMGTRVGSLSIPSITGCAYSPSVGAL